MSDQPPGGHFGTELESSRLDSKESDKKLKMPKG